MMTERSPRSLLHLLQLTSSALPVGAYSYSEGLETLAQKGRLPDAPALDTWLRNELRYGSIRLDGAMVLRVYRALERQDLDQLHYWNQWLSAVRETEELREQSWQMGRALVRLALNLEPSLQKPLQACGIPINFAIAFAVTAFYWQIDLDSALLGYFHSWATNLVGAGVKLIPLGQTAGQRVLYELYSVIQDAAAAVQTLPDDELASCGWGLAIASMNHEALYSRLFRS